MLGNNPSEYDFFIKKQKDKIYLSRSIATSTFQNDEEKGMINKIETPIRIVSKVFDNNESHDFIKEGKELVLRITEGQRHEVKVKFYEDTRGIFTLQLQKFSLDTGIPHNTHFSFTGIEISKLFSFLKTVPLLPISTEFPQV